LGEGRLPLVAILCNHPTAFGTLSQCTQSVSKCYTINCYHLLFVRSIKRNYKETKWLFVSALLCLPIWACWMSSYALIPSIYKDAVVALELVICATILLAFLFGPKIYILLSYEPIIVEYPPTKDNVNRYDLFDRGMCEYFACPTI
jgi:hypothetical protein